MLLVAFLRLLTDLKPIPCGRRRKKNSYVCIEKFANLEDIVLFEWIILLSLFFPLASG